MAFLDPEPPPYSRAKAIPPAAAGLRVHATGEGQASPSLPPKGAYLLPCTPFPCKTPFFWGPHEGAIMAFLDPEPPPYSRAKAMPPVVAVLLEPATGKRQASPSLPPKGAI